MLYWRARLPAGLIVLAALLAGCSEPAPWEASHKLLPKAGPFCTDSLARGFSRTPAPGSVKGPAFVYAQHDWRQIEDKYWDGGEKFSDWFATNPDIVRSYATKVDAGQAAVCIRHVFIQIGIYRPDNIAAVRHDWHVHVLRWPGGESLAGSVIPGQEPPPEIKVTAGQIRKAYYADEPKEAGKRWLNELIQ